MQGDRALIDAVIGGVPGAADEFVLRFSRFVYAILLRGMGLPPEVADELFQDLFVHLWEDGFRRLRLWRGEDDFAGYLAPIVRHLARDRGRRIAREPAADRFDDAEPFEEIARREPSPEELAAVEEQRRLVERAVEGMHRRYREVYRLRFVEQKKHREIAATLGIKVGAVGVALMRMEKRLARLVSEMAENDGISGKVRATVRSGSAKASPD